MSNLSLKMCVHSVMSDSLQHYRLCSLSDSSVHAIFQARKLEWAAVPPPGDLPHPVIEPMSPVAPALQVASLPLSHGGSPFLSHYQALRTLGGSVS